MTGSKQSKTTKFIKVFVGRKQAFSLPGKTGVKIYLLPQRTNNFYLAPNPISPLQIN
jgi:hypothetical protein